MSLTKADVVAHVSGELLRLGFTLIARSPDGSRYFSYPGSPFRLRVSGHKWGHGTVRRQVGVVCSWVVEERESGDIPALAQRIKSRYLERVDQRKNLA